MKKLIKTLSILGTLSLIITGCGSNAKSSARPNSYTIVWKNEDGILLEVDYDVLEGATPTYNGVTPHKNSDNQYNYVFSGWTPEVVPANANTTYVATYVEELRQYKVTWVDEDGSVIETDEHVPYGTTPEFNSLEPTKKSTAEYDYTFAGWTPEVTPVTGETTYQAKYQETVREYQITWVNENGDVIATNQVPYGETPVFSGQEPTKESTAQYTYTFDGWTPEITKVTGDTTYQAKFKDDLVKYKITWKNEDGSVIKTEEVPYGTVPAFDGDEPAKENTPQYRYSFNGWSPAVISVTGEAEYTATFKEEVRSYTVTWVNYDGSILEKDENILYGEAPTYNGETPTRENRRGVSYTFNNWSPEITAVTSDQTYVATYLAAGTFEFSLIPYELKEGVKESDLQGSPWVNLNIEGQIDKIEKPSLKDDFYGYVNYESIRDNTPGPFDVSSNLVREALSNIYSPDAPETTNGAVIMAMMDKLKDGDQEAVSSYLNNINLDTYMSSETLFTSTSSPLQLYPVEGGYEVAFNDGYISGSFGLHTLWFFADYYSAYLTPTTNMTSYLSSTYNLGFTDNDISNIHAFESNLIDGCYYGYNRYSNTNNVYSVDTVPWDSLKQVLLDLGLGSREVIYVKKYAYNAINTLFNSVNNDQRDTLNKAILARTAFDYRFLMGFDHYRVLNNYISQTGVFENENDLFKLPDEALARRLVEACLPILIEQTYLDQQGSPENKAKVEQLIQAILNGYIEMINENNWLSITSKNGVIKKLNKMKYEACYPDFYKYFTKIDQTDLENASIFTLYRSYLSGVVSTALHGYKLDGVLWSYMPTYTVNAFYAAQLNTFVILNGIVGGLLSETVEELYGTLGCVIGHEITHAFDSSGSRYDENGNYKDTWTIGDRNTFDNKVTKMVSFINKITLFNNTKANGDKTNGETTADMGGLKVMLKLAESIPDFDYDLFFKSFARLWKETPYSLDYAPSRAGNEHPFEYLRANLTLAQFDKFIETYDIQPGDGMYIPAEERIAIW